MDNADNEKASKKMSVKKILLALVAVLVSLWLIISVLWYIWREVTYSHYVENIEQSGYSGFLVPSYAVDEDGYTFSVKYPDYLSLAGNLSVWPDDDGVVLIIWPELDGGYTYGVRLVMEDSLYDAYIDETGSAVYDSDSNAVEQYHNEIVAAIDAAHEFWDLG